MTEVTIKDEVLRKAAEEGMDEFLQVFYDAIMEAIGGQLTAETMTGLNNDQITLLAYIDLRDEVMDGGFIQLIHNGYGAFIYRNPFAQMMKLWGIDGVKKLITGSHKYYTKYHEEIERDWSQDDFQALYERMPEFDDYDDTFVEHEEEFTEQIAQYVDDHLDNFATIEK